MKSNDILYSEGNNNECYTPSYAVTPILEYIPKNKIVWCPFDKENSEFVKLIGKQNEIIFSHIDFGQDFYKYEPEKHWDIIISNPPFENKRKIFERALSFKKPFALLMAMTWLNDSAPNKLFRKIPLELLMFDKRISYFIEKKEKVLSQPTFSSGYYCTNFLPQQIIMKELNKKNQISLF